MDSQEKALIERVLGGDNAAFEPLVLPYRRPLLALAYRIAQDAEDAKEIAQEALMRAYQYLGRCDLERSFRNWLYQILVNAARDHRRKKGLEAHWRSSEPLPDDSPAPDAGPEDAHQAGVLRARLQDCLGAVSAKEREVFLLRDIEQMDIRETASVLKCSEISVRVHLSRARRKIKAQMIERFPEFSEAGR